MNVTHTRGEDFLIWLAIQVKDRDDKRKGSAARKALADIRRAARNNLHDTYNFGYVYPHMGEYLGDQMTDEAEWLSAIGALYALAYTNVPSVKGVSLGEALRRLRDSDKGSDSLEARFMMLLNSREENLPGHLRQIIALLNAAQQNIGLDWLKLFHDVQGWDRGGRSVQKRWLHDYYRPDRQDANRPTDANTIPDTEDDNGDDNDEN